MMLMYLRVNLLRNPCRVDWVFATQSQGSALFALQPRALLRDAFWRRWHPIANRQSAIEN